MYNLKELSHLILAIIIFAFIISFFSGLNAYLTGLVIAAVIIFINSFAKKYVAYHYDSKIEQKIWHWQRWGYYSRSHLKRSIPAGLIFPFMLILISYPLGFLKVLTFLQFDAKPSTSRAARRRGSRHQRYLEMTEGHTAIIGAWSIFANIVLAVVCFIIGSSLSLEIAKYSIFYACWNLVPVSQLDGTKIFFGSWLLWIILATTSIISLILTIIFI